ncbi:unnamed protein product [Aphanomyces euteiches]
MDMNWYQSRGNSTVHVVHQVVMGLCALLVCVVNIWLFTILRYDFVAQPRWTVTCILLYVAHLALAVVLLLATVGGMVAPIRWFGIMGSFRGSGLFVIYLGVVTLVHLANTFGLVAGFICIASGVFFLLYGLLGRERTSLYYTPLTS